MYPIHVAAKEGHTKVVELLIEKMYDPNISTIKDNFNLKIVLLFIMHRNMDDLML